jgi:8-oxo-dGTP pyrophosphatase MutT (NUDIX family)
MVERGLDLGALKADSPQGPRSVGLPWVALALLEVEGRWLLQLRDDIAGIAAPGTWGLFGGHLDAGESPEQALRRELIEEINYTAGALHFWCQHRNEQRLASFFLGPLTVPLQALTLLEGQDLTLATPAELRSGAIHSSRLGETRPLAPTLRWAVDQLEICQWRPNG